MSKTRRILSISCLADILYFDKILTPEIANENLFELDLSHYEKFVRPLFVASLAQFIRVKRSIGFVFDGIRLDSGVKTKTSAYLEGIEFEKLFYTNFEVDKTSSINPYKSSLPIIVAPKEQLNDKINLIKSYFKNQCSTKDYQVIESHLSELLNNCYDHAQSKTGIVIHSQYYAKIDVIKFAVCDTGIGIVECVNNYNTKMNKPLLTSEEAINWALIDENTTKSTPRNRGRGLGILSSSMNDLNGEAWLITNDKFLYIRHNNNETQKTFFKSRPFFGTAFEIDIKVNKLHDIENAVSDFNI